MRCLGNSGDASSVICRIKLDLGNAAAIPSSNQEAFFLCYVTQKMLNDLACLAAVSVT